MNIFQAVWVVLVPFIPIVLPGAFFIRVHTFQNILISGTRAILWSMGVLTLITTASLAAGIPVTFPLVLCTGIAIGNIVIQRKQFFSLTTFWHVMAIGIPFLLGLVAFAIPFFTMHDGLPTGDVQKTILWAQESLQTNTTPQYQHAIARLNRDPVDFYTPGLHAVSSIILKLSPAPLTSIGLFAIVLSLCVAWIAATITKEMFDSHFHIVPPFLAALFTLTQYRFLRYLKEPGYHFQNVVGELFLFGMLLLFIRFMRRRESQDAFLFLVCGGALFVTHQFSMFIAVFTIAAAMVVALFEYRTRIIHAMKLHTKLSILAMAFLLIGLAVASSLELGNKLPALFTSTPHLIGLLPPLTNYPTTMGEVWFFTGLLGLITMVADARRKDEHHRQVMSFVAATGTILFLSQGPRFGVDIPPVRALFYIVVPFSVGAAYFFSKLFFVFQHWYAKKYERVAWGVLAVIIVLTCASSAYKAYAAVSHATRTNSTLTGEELGLAEQLEKAPDGGILIDDYNRRSASWLVLSGKPMVTRIAADIGQQMREAKQSTLRRELYIRQLQYEKIFALGSFPEITQMMKDVGIKYIAGVRGTSDTALSHNASLMPIGVADDVVVYTPKGDAKSCKKNPDCAFLIRPATLANDIGDEQDTFLHLMASIRSPQLSDPLYTGTITYRQTTASRIPLVFNVGDYVQALWDPNEVGRPETSLMLLVAFTNPVEGLSLISPSGNIIPIPPQAHGRILIPSDMAPFDEKGFIMFVIDNPHQRLVGINSIALGPSLIP